MSVELQPTFRLSPPVGWALAILLAVFALAPLTYPGYFESDSGFLPAFRATQPLVDPAWMRPAGELRGEGRLPFLLALPFYRLSGSGVVAAKWSFGLAIVLSAVAAYAWTRPRLGIPGGVLAAAVYTYLPWHLETVYGRGALAEAWLWVWWPCQLWAVDRLSERSPRSLVVAALVGLPALAAAFWTQPGLSALFVPILVAYAVVRVARRDRLAPTLALALALVALGLWLLAHAAPGAESTLARPGLYPFQLFVPAGEGEPSFQLGPAAVGLALVTLSLGSRRRLERPGVLFWVSLLLPIVVLTLAPAVLLWQVTGLAALVSHSWQLLALAGLPLALLAGSVVPAMIEDERLASLPVWAGLLALVLLASYGLLAPRLTRLDPGNEPLAAFRPVDADAAQILLLDVQVEQAGEITPTLWVTLTWQAIEPVTADYTVFVHVLAPGDEKVAQVDRWPCGGECPTSTWQPGELVVDPYRLSLPAGPAPASHRLALGLYLPDSGRRAAIVGRDDDVVIADVP